MVIKTCRPHPLDLIIVEVLEKKGAMTDTELFDLLRETHEELGFGDFNKTLMLASYKGVKIYRKRK